MRSILLLVAGAALSAGAVVAGQAPQAQAPQPANLQAPQDPRYAEVTAQCTTPPARGGGPAAGRAGAPGPAAGARGEGARGDAARAGGAPPQGAAANAGRGAGAPAAGPAEYSVDAIPGVVAAAGRWTLVWQTTGNNADGIIAAEDGGLLLAQNDNGVVVKLDRNHQPSIAYRDTNAGGALSMSPSGALFIASRGIGTAVLQMAPERRVFANRYQGEPLECLGGVLNDVAADSRGGVYFTMGGIFYADPTGAVTQYGENLRTNGVLLSPDEKTLYVTNGNTVAAFDVRADGSLQNQRTFATLPAGNGDGLAVDDEGRLYVTAGAGGGAPGVHVFATDGAHLGTIAGPRSFITAAFGGPGKQTLYAVANDRRVVEVYTMPMLAKGYQGRAK